MKVLSVRRFCAATRDIDAAPCVQHASISRKAQDIRPFLVMDVLQRAQAIERETGVNVIHLEVGEPDFDTPPAIVDASPYRCHARW